MTDPGRTPIGSALQRFRRSMRWLALVAVAATVAALGYVGSQVELSLHVVLATTLGVFFAVLLGVALMSLAFLSSSSGHDSDAGSRHDRSGLPWE